MNDTTWFVDCNDVYIGMSISPTNVIAYLKHAGTDAKSRILQIAKGYTYAITAISKYMPAGGRNVVRFNSDDSINMVDKLGHSSYYPSLASFGQPKVTYSGKIVRFNYTGGTKPGSVRVVKVSTDNGTTLYGKDLEKGEDRSYLRNRISGGIEVIA